MPSPERKILPLMKYSAVCVRPFSPTRLTVFWELLWHVLWHTIQFWKFPGLGDHVEVPIPRTESSEKNQTCSLCLFCFALPCSCGLIRGEQSNLLTQPPPHQTTVFPRSLHFTTGPPPAPLLWWNANTFYWGEWSQVIPERNGWSLVLWIR